MEYDTYDECVVAAEDEISAKIIHPRFGVFHKDGSWWSTSEFSGQTYSEGFDEWPCPAEVKVKLIGTSSEELAGTVICASYNAG